MLPRAKTSLTESGDEKYLPYAGEKRWAISYKFMWLDRLSNPLPSYLRMIIEKFDSAPQNP
jgi:hypothetical protein